LTKLLPVFTLLKPLHIMISVGIFHSLFPHLKKTLNPK
jgi:hypothetical protein